MLMYVMSFSAGSDSKDSAYNGRDPGMIPGSRGSRAGNSYPLQYSCLENSMDRRVWRAIAQGVTKSQTQPSDFHTMC